MAQIPRGTLGLTDELSDASFDNRQRGVRESSVASACDDVTFPMTRVWESLRLTHPLTHGLHFCRPPPVWNPANKDTHGVSL